MTRPTELIRFPPVTAADRDGLLMVGGKLTPSWALAAYRQGVFPWPMVDGDFEMLPLQDFSVSRRVRRRIRKGEFQVTANQDFAGVVSGCAGPRRHDSETWITRSMAELYHRLHNMGHAPSIEVWQDGYLVGGVVGVSLGGLFSAESMFHRKTDAGKVAIYYLVRQLRERGFQLLDVQQWSPHMSKMGVIEIPREQYLAQLRVALRCDVSFGELTPDLGETAEERAKRLHPQQDSSRRP